MKNFFTNPVSFFDETRIIDGVKISSTEDLLAQSQASEAFKDTLRDFLIKPQPCNRIRYPLGTPAIKIVRTIMKLLENYPDLPFDAVAVAARSGCATFEGIISVEPQKRQFEFIWDCQWRAQQNNLTNAWGMPDQVKAAHDFGYQCYQKFEEIEQA